MGAERATPPPLTPRELEAGESYFIGGPWAEQRRRLDDTPDELVIDAGVYDGGPDTPHGAAVYHWRWQPPPRVNGAKKNPEFGER